MHPNVYIPEQFVDYLATFIIDKDDRDATLAACRRPLRKSIRVNTLRISVDEFKRLASENGWLLDPIPWCTEGFWIDGDNESQLGASAEHLAGLFYIQEASSMLPPVALLQGVKLAGSEKILDMASAPGSKSTQLGSLLNGQGLLVTNEYSSSRIKALAANIIRCGVSNAALSHFNGNVFGEWLPNTFDYVLLDAPCSGEGSVRKDPDAMKNWSLAHVNSTAELQFELLESAVKSLKPGGTLVYSTCTINTIENQSVCHRILARYPQLLESLSLARLFDGAERSTTAEGFLHVLPHTYDSEGFFIAKFKKLDAHEEQPAPSKKGKFPFTPCAKKWQNEFHQYLSNTYGMALPTTICLYQKDKEIWVFPDRYLEIMNDFKFQRCGVKVAELHRTGFRLTHDFAAGFGGLAKKSVITINSQQMVMLYAGQDIKSNDFSGLSGEFIIQFAGTGISISKIINGKLKNRLPKGVITSKR